MTQKFKTKFSEEVIEFLGSIEEKARNKIIRNTEIAESKNDKKLFTKLTSNYLGI